jgi:hypothetical protein
VVFAPVEAILPGLKAFWRQSIGPDAVNYPAFSGFTHPTPFSPFLPSQEPPVMFDRNLTLSKADPDVWAAIQKEDVRQEQHIELIASENYASPAVMEAQGTQLTNKYAEGYPGKRYYGGCEYVDVVEQLAIDRLKQIFGAEAANVQPNSGSQANQGVYMAVLKPGDTVLGMSLAEGGHLTHGASVNASGKLYNFISYGLDENEVLNYAQVEQLAREHKPKLIVAGASAYALHIDFERMARIARENGALFMVDIAHYAGLVAGGAYPNPVPHADFVTSTTHKSLRGPRGGVIMMKAEHEKIVNSAIFPKRYWTGRQIRRYSRSPIVQQTLGGADSAGKQTSKKTRHELIRKGGSVWCWYDMKWARCCGTSVYVAATPSVRWPVALRWRSDTCRKLSEGRRKHRARFSPRLPKRSTRRCRRSTTRSATVSRRTRRCSHASTASRR